MNNINNLINSVLISKKNKEKYYNAYLQLHWQEIVGTSVSQKSLPNSIQNHILFLNVVGSSWAHNLLMMKNELLKKINTFLQNKIYLKDIKIHSVAKIDKIKIEEKIQKEINLPELDNEEQIAVLDIVNIAKNKDLVNKFFLILTKDKQYKKLNLQTGFKKCVICSVPLSYKDEICTVCKKDNMSKIKEKLLELFLQIPWVTFAEAKETINCNEEQFIQVKKQCEQMFLQKALEKNPKSSNIRRYVMLKTGCSIFSLNDDLITSTMEQVRRSYNVSPYRFGCND